MKVLFSQSSALVLILIAVMLISGCAETEITSPIPEGDKGITLTAKASEKSNPDTKLGYNEDEINKRLKFIWENNGSTEEQFSTFVENGGTTPVTFNMTSGNATSQGVFSGFFSTPPSVGNKLYAIYPALPTLSSDSKYDPKLLTLDLRTQTLATTTDALKHNKSHYLWASTTYKGGSDIDFSFDHLVSILKLDINLPEGAGAIKTLVLSGQKAQAILNVTDGKLTFENVNAGESVMTTTDAAGIALTKENTLKAYIYLFPQVLTSANKLTIRAIDVDGRLYEGVFNGRNVEQGKMYMLNVTLHPLIMTPDRQALISVYNALNGINWTQNANQNWDTEVPLNQWNGVETNNKGDVIGVTLTANSNVKGDFPIAFTQLSSLETLVIEANQVTGSIPKEIGELKELKAFRTTGNQMGGDIPRELGSLTKLADLNIAKQFHTGQIWKELKQLPAYKDIATFTNNVMTQYQVGTTIEVTMPIEINVNVQDGTIKLTKSAQSHVINLPGDIESQSFDYTSLPAGHNITLEYMTSDILPVNKTAIEASFSENNTGATITYTININGKNKTTGIVEKYIYKIEHTNDNTPRKDGDLRVYIKSKRPNDKSYGVVYMSDGFILEDLQPGKDYDKYANKALNYVFSKEPFATYRDYLNVYVVYVESKQRGLEGKLDTRYMSNGYPTVDQATVKKYAEKAPLYIFARLIGINHSDPALSSGLTINDINALFIVKSENVALHEFGHILGLGDEYQLNGYPGLSQNTKNYANLDITGDLSKVKWKHFLGLPGYEDVGVYEGGLYQSKGVWRPENLSMMKTYHKEFPEFNAPSREAIVKKILDYSEVPYSFKEFLRLDKKTKQPKL